MYKKAVSLLLPIIVMAWFASQTFAEDNRKNDSWPRTVKAAVSNILSTMSNKDKDILKKTKKEDLIKFHHGLGTGIRNEFGLWKGNEELLISACGKPCHPDEASMVIIEAVWIELQKNP